MKAPHHGTEGLADNLFFRTAAPRDVLVPSPNELWASDRSSRTRAVLEELGCHVWVNGLHGHIKVIFKKNGYEITHCFEGNQPPCVVQF